MKNDHILAHVLLLPISFVILQAQGFGPHGDFNFSGLTLPDPSGFDPYTDAPIQNDPTTPGEIEALLKDYTIIPDVLMTSPNYTVQVRYVSPFHDEPFTQNTTIGFGTVLKMLEWEVEPDHISWPFSCGSYYTLILTDPDSPTPQDSFDREFHHWLVGNIFENNWKDGDVITEYIGAVPPVKAGTHRFVFIVFEQPKGKIHFKEPSVHDLPPLRKRNKFNTLQFAEKYDLGQPYAVNFFQVHFNDWIPTVRNWTTPFFAILSSEWTTVYQKSPRTKATKTKFFPTPEMLSRTTKIPFKK